MKNNKTNIIIVVIMLLATFVSVGYGFFAQKLAFKNPLPLKSNTENVWNVSFTNAVKDSSVGNPVELAPVSFDSSKASFNIQLTKPGDSITYDFTISNLGKLDAKVDSILIIPSNKPEEPIIYAVSGITAGDELNVGESTHAKVTATFDKNAKEKITSYKKTITVIINYVQK